MSAARDPDAASREVTDDLGTSFPVASVPRRLVSLVPNLSEMLWWWHLADRVVAVTDYCAAPPHAFDHAARVRGTKNPDVRAIVDLAPDLVVASEEENRELDVRRLRDAGVAVHVTRVRTLADAAASFERLGDAVGAPAAGLGLRRGVHRAVETALRPATPVRAVCAIWRDDPQRGGPAEGWWLLGRDTVAGDLLATAGFALLPEDRVASHEGRGTDASHEGRGAASHEGRTADGRYPRRTLADLADLDPDVVLLPDEPYAFGEADAEVFARWRARVRHLDGTALTWWGPRTPSALGDLARLARQLARPRRRARGQ